MLFILNTVKKDHEEALRRKKLSDADHIRLRPPCKHHALRRTSSLSRLDLQGLLSMLQEKERLEEKHLAKPPLPATAASGASKPHHKQKMQHAISLNEQLNLATNIAQQQPPSLYIEMNKSGEMVIKQRSESPQLPSANTEEKQSTPPALASADQPQAETPIAVVNKEPRQRLNTLGAHEAPKTHRKLQALKNTKKALSMSSLLHKLHIHKSRPEEETKGRKHVPTRASSDELLQGVIT